VKTHHIEIDIRGDIPGRILSVLKEVYGNKVKLIREEDDLQINVFESEWYKDIAEKTGPGDAMRIYRENIKMTQEELGQKLGGISRQNISHMERGKRAISLKTARKLTKLFNVPLEYFVEND